MEEQKPTINNIPNELLEEVFKWLDAESLRCSSLVCVRWNNKICNSSLTRKVTLEINADFLENERGEWQKAKHQTWIKYADHALSQQKIVKVKFCGINFEDDTPNFLRLVESHGQKLTHLTLNTFNLPRKLLMDLLGSVENLRTFNVLYGYLCKKKVKGEIIELPSQLAKLKNVKFKGSLDYTAALTRAQPTTIEINMIDHSSSETLKRFLAQQNNLTTLKIEDSFIFMVDMLAGIEQVFPLTSFTYIIDESFKRYQELPDLLTFLQKHGKLLKTLKIRCYITVETLEFILHSLENLESLSLYFPMNYEDVEHLPSRPSVRHLELKGRWMNEEIVIVILGAVPNLESLALDKAEEKVFQFIDKHQRNLRSLSVLSFPCFNPHRPNIFSTITCPEMKELHCESIISFATLNEFIRNQPIERIIIDDVASNGSVTEESLSPLIQHSSVKYIIAQGHRSTMEKFIDIAKKIKWKSLATLEVKLTEFHQPTRRIVLQYHDVACESMMMANLDIGNGCDKNLALSLRTF